MDQTICPAVIYCGSALKVSLDFEHNDLIKEYFKFRTFILLFVPEVDFVSEL